MTKQNQHMSINIYLFEKASKWNCISYEMQLKQTKPHIPKSPYAHITMQYTQTLEAEIKWN